MEHLDVARRRFVLRALPACAGACVVLNGLPAAACSQAPAAGAPPQPPADAHKFDREIPRRPTYRELWANTYSRAFIPLALFMTKRLGRERTLDLLKASAEEQAALQALEAAKVSEGTDFAAFKRLLTAPRLSPIWTMNVVEDSDSVYEIRVTECLWAATFRAANAGECGYAAVCHGDFGFATGFNARLQLVRDRTLMQGHPFCNHRYLWKR